MSLKIMNRVYLGLGSNLGDKEQNVLKAIDLISKKIGEVIKVSSMYETAPVGFDSDNMFVNVACLLLTELDRKEVLKRTKIIEQEMGRSVKSHNGVYTDRIIDIDILLFNNDVLQTSELTLPHPHLHQRGFVIYPLAEIAADIMHPVLNKTMECLKKDFDSKSN